MKIRHSLCFFILSCVPLYLYGQTFDFGKNEGQILDAKKLATLKIQFYSESNQLLNTFAGFFIDNSGRIITVNHTFKDDFSTDGKSKILIQDINGNTYSKISILGCGNKNELDLCILQIKDLKPKSYFEASPLPRQANEPFTTIGHCKNKSTLEPFNVKKGKIISIVEDYVVSTNDILNKLNLKTKLFTVDLDECVGDSGSPVFNSFNGALIGTFSFFTKKSSAKKYNYYAIDADEIKKFLIEVGDRKPFEIPLSRIYEEESECDKYKVGSREYENCKTLE